MQKLEQRIGYIFKNKKILVQALTHSSYTADIHENYERLEFLGDRILGFTIAEMLCKVFENEPEGSLSQRFVRLVCKETVAEIAKNLGVEKFIITNNPEVREKENVLCDVGEALIAAIYLDSGDMGKAQQFIHDNWSSYIDKSSRPRKDFKTRLQELVALLKLNAPVYSLLEKRGPEHEPEFVVSVAIDNEHSVIGVGKNKKSAEQEAAQKMLVLLGVKDV